MGPSGLRVRLDHRREAAKRPNRASKSCRCGDGVIGVGSGSGSHLTQTHPAIGHIDPGQKHRNSSQGPQFGPIGEHEQDPERVTISRSLCHSVQQRRHPRGHRLALRRQTPHLPGGIGHRPNMGRRSLVHPRRSRRQQSGCLVPDGGRVGGGAGIHLPGLVHGLVVGLEPIGHHPRRLCHVPGRGGSGTDRPHVVSGPGQRRSEAQLESL